MEAWENFLKLQDAELGIEVVNKWLRPLKVVNFDACNLYLQAKDTFQITWFNEYVKKNVGTLLRNNNNKPIKVHLTTEEAKPLSVKKSKNLSKPIPQLKISPAELDPHNTFNNYVFSEGNLLVTKLCEGLIATGGASTLGQMNPLYIHGISGTGKTHLLQAITKTLRDQKRNAIYTRADTFTEHLVSAIRSGEMSAFRQAYRNADVLLIDDVHIFSRKAATQEELFHTFNTLHLSGRQIILSSNCSPAELQSIEPRLVSRFEWGIVLPLAFYTEKDLKEILHKKAASFQLQLHEKVITFLVETFKSSSKALVRSLEALMLRLPNNPSLLTVPAAKALLKDLIEEEQKNILTPQKIVHAVAEYFDVQPEDVLGKNQSRECVLPRQLAMHFCRTQLDLPFMKIGDLFGKDHSTVMSSVKLIQKAIDGEDHEIAAKWDALLKKLKG